MLATDVAARGLDVKDITHVINYDMAESAENYIHRIGRTARGEATGTAVTFFTEDDNGMSRTLTDILKETQQEVPQFLQQLRQPAAFNDRRRYSR
jgi:ATP-dependent RNA helicase DDX5/DBP2